MQAIPNAGDGAFCFYDSALPCILSLVPQPIVFVSGGSGFVGTAVIRELVKREYHVHALVHRRPLRIDDARITLFRGELDDPAALYPAMERASAVIHLVGIIREDRSRNITFHRMHIDLTRAVVDACIKLGVLRFIHMSALGARSDSPSLYHQTKAAAEQIVRASPLSWTILRPSLIHGAGGEFTQLLTDWANGTKPPWLFMPYFGRGLLGIGRQSLIQPIRVEDVARAFVDAIEKPNISGKSYDLAGRQQLTWPAMYRTFSRSLRGKAKPALPIPAWYALLLTRLLPASLLPFNRAQILMSQEDSTADIQPFEADFGFTPQGFEQSLTTNAPSPRPLHFE